MITCVLYVHWTEIKTFEIITESIISFQWYLMECTTNTYMIKTFQHYSWKTKCVTCFLKNIIYTIHYGEKRKLNTVKITKESKTKKLNSKKLNSKKQSVSLKTMSIANFEILNFS